MRLVMHAECVRPQHQLPLHCNLITCTCAEDQGGGAVLVVFRAALQLSVHVLHSRGGSFVDVGTGLEGR